MKQDAKVHGVSIGPVSTVGPGEDLERGLGSFLVRLDDNELDALRQVAYAQGRSMNDLAREGLRLVTSGAERDERVRGLARRVMTEHAGLLKRLGEA